MGFRECRDGWSGRVILVSTETRLQKPTLGFSGFKKKYGKLRVNLF